VQDDTSSITIIMNSIILNHAKLGLIKCLRETNDSLIKILGLPYGTISQRFARAELSSKLSDGEKSRYQTGIYDATRPGPSSIQPWGSVKSDAANIPLPTDNLPEDEEQSEDCLNLSIHLPQSCLDEKGKISKDTKLPVLVFIHGGAYFLGSGNRPYYSPVSLMHHAISHNKPIIFVSINYRLGALGFWHTNHAGNLLPENNGLHDQDLAFKWLEENIGGFGGDVENVSVIGQSAGGESISVQTMRRPLFRRAIMLSGTPVTMPAMTHEEHHNNFLTQAEKLGIRVKEADGSERDTEAIAKKVIDVEVSKIRELAWVGSPCTNSTFFPFERPTMESARKGKLAPPDWKEWAKPVEAQIVGSTTYDGGISFNMMSKDESRKEHAKAFQHIAKDVLGAENGRTLCEIYGMKEDSKDADALQRICLFESDIGFFAAALSIAEGSPIKDTYFQIFDLPNPFPGPIREQGAFATHTFDISTLLGGVHEDRLPEQYKAVIARWRDTILDFMIDGTPPCERYIGKSGEDRKALLVGQQGVREVDRTEYMENKDRRRSRLFELADRVAGEAGWDVLWVDVCRKFLMRGE
jgi:carboxylesterase type B